MSKLYVDVDGTDIPVKIKEFMGEQRVKVQAEVGFPFDCEPNGKAVSRCSSDIAVVKYSQVRIG